MTGYKYYFKKPKGEIVKDILLWLAIGGAIAIAATSPSFGMNLVRTFLRSRKHNPKSTVNAFRRLYKAGHIAIAKRNHQVYISLTEEGKRRAGIYQINALRVKKPKHWDRRWRIVIFDVPHENRFIREALRGLLKQLGFYQLQKSVWIHPFDCTDEIFLVSSFFGLTAKELRLITTDSIGEDTTFKEIFNLT